MPRRGGNSELGEQDQQPRRRSDGWFARGRRYGERTWFEDASHKLAVFDKAQAAAIVAYLDFKREADEFERETIDQALANFWRRRAAGADG